MAFFDCKLYSHVLHFPTRVSVFLPDSSLDSDAFNVVLLLHGMCCDGADFFLRTRVAEYAQENNCVLIAPSCGNNYFADGKNGLKYETYLLSELLPYFRKTFGLSADRDKNIAMGVSMGAYAAVRMGLSKPEQFSAVVSLSAPIDLKRAIQSLNDLPNDVRLRSFYNAFHQVYGTTDEFDGSNADVLKLLETVSPDTAPEFCFYVGNKDPLWALNEKVAMHMKYKGLAVDICVDDGDHDWKYWDPQLEKFFKRFAAKK